MYRLPSIVSFILLAAVMTAQSPHGDSFKMDCAACHTPDGWSVQEELISFSHDSTRFALDGQHIATDCRSCHTTLLFKEAEITCSGCHTDVHSQTLGMDCRRCHETRDWLVRDITGLHDQISFPLLGAHRTASCFDCHQAENDLRYDLNGIDCINCHREDYSMAESPDHVALNYALDCTECHRADGFGWDATNIDHSFFPLEKGHEITDCAACHQSDNYADISSDCFSCHQADFESTQNPDHAATRFSTDCASCHTTDPGWMPAEFQEHDQLYFPIYSGEHAGEWNTCAACHESPGNFAEFTCISCHEHNQPDMDHEHADVSGYTYSSQACLACHPDGSTDGVFDHNLTDFPLTGAHIQTDCIDCHASGFTGTSTVCADCHEMDFTSSLNPNHGQLNLSTDCAACHTTDPEWNPAQFPDHNDFYALNGAHAAIANDCAACHNGDYNNTPNTCAGCHQEDYDQTTSPPHAASQFTTDCAGCHSEDAWEPSTFDHDGMYFPIYSGSHMGEWDDCIQCHTNPDNFAVFSCLECHQAGETDEEHEVVPGYIFESNACLACHPSGEKDGFNHNETAFPLTGEHLSTDCIACHAEGYAGTSTICADCHSMDFNASLNPNHGALGLPMDCAACHTTDPDWNPALFPDHDNFYTLNGAHTAIANDCASCHNGDYNNTPNTCAGCHLEEYQQTTDPNHAESQFPTNCAICHSENAWEPADFDHGLTDFPLTGEHITTDCIDCHAQGYTGTSSMCADCHNMDYNESLNPNHGALGLPMDCAACHTTDPDWNPALFPEHDNFYILNGAHAAIANDCSTCHNGDYNNTPNTCAGCHQSDYDQTTDPPHAASQFSTDCASCHTEDAWEPSTFDHDGMYFPIYTGAHAGEWDACTQCHTNPDNFSVFSCLECHLAGETNDGHEGVNGYMYESNACLACHPTGDESGFNHNETNFPLTGLHLEADCIACHAEGFAGTSSVCADCHTTAFNEATNPNHTSLGLPMDCAACHTTDADWNPAQFPEHNSYYALNGAHAAVANDCAGCHNGDYNNTPTTCVGCHLDDYSTTTDPNHAESQFPTTCAVCHNEDAWTPADFDHNLTSFPLTGGHISLECASCHAAGYTGTSAICADCHTADFNQTSNPDHGALGIPNNCAACHSTDPDWNPASFDIHDTYYPLNGAHAGISNDCATCHNGDYNNTPATCAGCHLDDYNATTNPDHAASQFTTDCIACHTENSWIPATFDHDNTAFPLTGEHLGADCIMCHAEGYAGTSTICADCHTADFNQSSNPDHGALGIPNDCAACHSTDPDWNPASFDIHDNYYALNGVHATISTDCAACHNGDYNNTPATCAGCHLDDYNATADPSHTAAQFPTDCASCHGENAWQPSTFDHDGLYFPIYSGKHDGEWNTCSECHNDAGNFSIFTCLGCHLPGPTGEDHSEVNEYIYESNACLACHPDGEG